MKTPAAILGLFVVPSVGAQTETSVDSATERSLEIVFRSDRGGGNDGLYRMLAADGAGVRRLVANQRDVLHFAVHPAGDRIAYVCDPDDTEAFELHVLDLATGQETPVHHGIRLAPRWSRDGRRLAFMHYSSKWRIRLTDPDLVIDRPEQSHIGGDGAPSWFPGDARIAFQSNRTGQLELFTADTTTGQVTRLTTTARAESSPLVSPDGVWIAYRSGRGLGVIRADGSGARLLTSDDQEASGYAWSPDSKRLAFAWKRDGNLDIYTTSLAADAAPVRLTRHAGDDHSPAWSPDGGRLAFVSERDGDPEVYVVGAGGQGLTRLTRDPGRDRSPAWLAPPTAATGSGRAPDPPGRRRRSGQSDASARDLRPR